jgi:hypothetical protein
VEDDMNDRQDDAHDDDDIVRPRVSALGRRDLMKLGAGVVVTALNAPRVAAQSTPSGPLPVRTRAGYVYNANRESHNGPMDDTSRKIVNRVCAYKEVADAHRDQARATWSNLRAVKDIGEAMRTLAKFGNPKPL